MELVIKIIFLTLLIITVLFVFVCFHQLNEIEDTLRCISVNNDMDHARIKGSVNAIQICSNYIMKQISEEKEHIYMSADGSMKCRKTDKYISCSAIGFNNLEYCPFCGEKLRKE